VKLGVRTFGTINVWSKICIRMHYAENKKKIFFIWVAVLSFILFLLILQEHYIKTGSANQV
jgi:hypothetical protein